MADYDNENTAGSTRETNTGPHVSPHLSPRVSRRGFLAASAVGGVALGASLGLRAGAQSSGGSFGNSGAGGQGLEQEGVRRNIYAQMQTPEGQANIESYRRGVAAMKAKPFSDPTSWTFQAAIHDRATGRSVPELPEDIDGAIAALPPDLQVVLGAANTCQHHNNFFAFWHRMYLYFLEKNIRAASGDANFMLPYWNYSDSAAERAMPEPFRQPADRNTNALYEDQRSAWANNGDPVNPAWVSTSAAMGQAQAIAPAPDLGFYAQVERMPHDQVHGRIGGLMGRFNTAALDPIFWMHHCNIDRLWTKWIQAGHTDTNDPAILGQRYRFIDDDGSIVTMSVLEVIGTGAQLGYVYDDDAGPEAGFVRAEASGTGVEGARLADDLAVVNQGFTLGTAPVVAEAAPVVEAAGAALFTTDVSDPNERPVYLVLEGVAHDDTVPVFYNIYVNRPDDVSVDPANGYFAGSYYPFSPTDDAGVSITFDITGLLNRQVRDGIYEAGPLKVEILPELADTGGVEAGPIGALTVGRIAIVR